MKKKSKVEDPLEVRPVVRNVTVRISGDGFESAETRQATRAAMVLDGVSVYLVDGAVRVTTIWPMTVEHNGYTRPDCPTYVFGGKAS
jgi:hypothetical protein